MAVLDATNLLKAMVQADIDPTLTADEIETILSLCAVVDEFGLEPQDAGWTATYDMNRAAASGWRFKAGKVANRYTFGSDARQINRSDFIKHCMEMAKIYTRRVTADVEVAGSTLSRDTEIIGNLNL